MAGRLVFLCGSLRISALNSQLNAEDAEIRREPQRRAYVMKFFLTFILLATFSFLAAPRPEPSLVGRWRVQFTLSAKDEKNLIFEAKPKGSGVLHLLDTGPDNKPVPEPQPAVWSAITEKRVSFAANVELPLGTCCREAGTLIFKGTYTSHDSIKGKTIFIATTTDEENFVGYRTDVGAFTATRER